MPPTIIPSGTPKDFVLTVPMGLEVLVPKGSDSPGDKIQILLELQVMVAT